MTTSIENVFWFKGNQNAKSWLKQKELGRDEGKRDRCW